MESTRTYEKSRYREPVSQKFFDDSHINIITMALNANRIPTYRWYVEYNKKYPQLMDTKTQTELEKMVMWKKTGESGTIAILIDDWSVWKKLTKKDNRKK